MGQGWAVCMGKDLISAFQETINTFNLCFTHTHLIYFIKCYQHRLIKYLIYTITKCKLILRVKDENSCNLFTTG